MVKRALRLERHGARHGILVQPTGLLSLRQTQCFAPALASRLHNQSIWQVGCLILGLVGCLILGLEGCWMCVGLVCCRMWD